MKTINNICNLCNGRGFIYNKDSDTFKPCECVERKRKRSIYKTIGLPLKFEDIDIDKFYLKQDAFGSDLSKEEKKKKQIARNVVESFIEQIPLMLSGELFTYSDMNGSSLILYGGRHSGKSMLAACIAKGCLNNQHYPYFLEWAELINVCFDYNVNVMGQNFLKANDYEDLSSIVQGDRLLIIDNLDESYEKNVSVEEKLTPSVKRKLDAMFSDRYKKSIPLVFTTNQTENLLLQDGKYGPILKGIFEDALYVELPEIKGMMQAKKLN